MPTADQFKARAAEAATEETSVRDNVAVECFKWIDDFGMAGGNITTTVREAIVTSHQNALILAEGLVSIQGELLRRAGMCEIYEAELTTYYSDLALWDERSRNFAKNPYPTPTNPPPGPMPSAPPSPGTWCESRI